jgi:N-methylhydantoinase A
MRIAIDTGGTFTDCVYLENGRLQILKVRSTPDDRAAAVLAAVARIARGKPAEVRLGTTVGTNALLERTGARVAFVTTAGFEDTLAIGRQARSRLYDLFFPKEQPLAPAGMRFGVEERTASDGSILQPIRADQLKQLREAIRSAAPESIAISLLFAFANPANERAVAAALEEIGVPLSLSHEILPEFREYERASTVTVNAYLAPKMQTYLMRLDAGLAARESRLDVMQSSGGIVSAATAAREPVRTILSGPAGGVVGAMAVAKGAGFTNLLTFDMGGTSTDVAFVASQRGLTITTESQIAGMPVAIPMLDIHTAGAGGGSLAGFDCGGVLRVGPESAGADPGPACYGLGQRPTVTDANLLLGRLDADYFLGGEMKLNEERARESLERSRGMLPAVHVFADGIVRLAEAHMAQALRKISVEQGRDPRDCVLVSFGGAGPLHACALANILHIPRVLVPPFPGALSAYGIWVSDAVRDHSRTVMLRPDDSRLPEYFLALEHGSADVVIRTAVIRTLDMRYVGQGYELNVPWSGDFVAAFHALHAERYGYSDPRRPVEVVNVRVRMISVTNGLVIEPAEVQEGDGTQAVRKEKRMYCDGEWRSGKIYDRTLLRAGDTFAGPAVIAEYSATTFLPPETRLQVDQWLNLIIEL